MQKINFAVEHNIKKYMLYIFIYLTQFFLFNERQAARTIFQFHFLENLKMKTSFNCHYSKREKEILLHLDRPLIFFQPASLTQLEKKIICSRFAFKVI